MLQIPALAAVVVIALGSVQRPVDDVDAALPRGAIARMGSDRLLQEKHIGYAAISPDGHIIAATGNETLWYDGDTGKYISDKTIILWDAATGKRLRTLEVPHAPAFHFEFSPDGKQIGVSYGRDKSGIAILEVASGKVVRQLTDSGMRLVHFTPDGKSLIVTEEYRDKISLWNIETNKRTRTWERPRKKSPWLKKREYITDGDLSPDGKFLAWLVDVAPDYSKVPPGVLVPPHVPNPTGLILVNADNGERVYRKEFPPGALERFAFFADGKSFMTNEARPAVYETATGREQFSFPADSTYNFVLSPNGRFAAAMSGASQVSLWDLEKKKRAHELLTGMIPARLGNFSADGKSLLVTTLRTLRVFDTATGKERLSLGHCSRVTPRFSDDDRTLITTCDELRRTWDVSSKKTPKLVREQPRNPWEGICGRQVVGHSKDGRYFVDGKGRDNLKLCETATGKVIRGLDSYPHPIFGMFSRDASRLLIWHGAIGEDFDGFRLYDVATGKKTGQMATPERAGYYPALSNDGRSIAWADRVGAIHLHDGATGRPIRVLRSEKNICNDADLLFTPDGSHIIVATSHHDLFRKPDGVKWVTNPVRVYRVSDGKEISQFHANPKTTNRAMSWACAAVSRSGRLVAVAEKDSPAIRVFDVMKGKLLAEFDGHRGGVHGLAFSHDEQILASGGEDAIVTLWDVAGLK